MSKNPVDFETENYEMPAERLAKVMLFFQRSASWPAWKMGLAILFLTLLCVIFMLLLGAEQHLALLVGIMQLLFYLGDILLLSLLPRFKISFGSWKAQFFPLAIPRTLATIIVAFVSFAGGWNWTFYVALGIQAFASITLVWGAFVEAGRLYMTELEIHVDHKASVGDPIRILHISDLHIERLSRREDAILQFIESAEPHLILLTGDYVNLSYNRDEETYRQLRKFLDKLRAPFGVFATLGTPAADARELIVPLFADLHIELLRDSSQLVMVKDKHPLLLLGLDCTHNIARDSSVLRQLQIDAPNGVTQILLYHSPELMPQAVDLGVDLYLCGHTHGGQVRLPFVGPLLTSSKLGRQYVMGEYKQGHTQLYVSRGVGLEGLSAPRVRLLAPPEITLLRIWD